MASLDDLLQEAAALSLSTPPPVGGSVSFASPVAAVASPTSMTGVIGSGGGGEGTVGDSKRVYSVVLVPGEDRSICFGLIGVGRASFCIRRNCSIKSHNANKIAEVKFPTFFISRVIGSTVFTQPSALQSRVPIGTQGEWEGKSKSLSLWNREFRAISISDDTTASSDDIKAEVQLLDNAAGFRTPSKKRKGQVGLSEPLNIVSIPSHSRSLPETEDSDRLERMIEGGTLGRGGLTRVVSKLETSVVEMGKSMEEIVGLVHGRFVDNEENVGLISGSVQNILATLGPTEEIDEKFEAPTLWGTASIMGEEVARLVSDVEKSKEGFISVVASVKTIVARVERVEEDKTTDETKIREVLAWIMKRVQAISPEMEAIRNKVAMIDAEVSKGPRSKRFKAGAPKGNPNLSAGNPMMDDLMAMIGSDREDGRGVPFQEGDRDDDGSESFDGKFVLRTEEDLLRIAGDIEKLVRDVGILKTSTEDKSIKFGGLGLRDLSECSEWVKINFSSLRYGLIMDPLLMLDRVFGSDDMDAESQFKVLESRVKLKIKTGAEAAAIKALHFNRPRLFHKGRVAMVSERNTSKLSKLPTYKSWKSGGEGVMIHVIKQMNLIYSTVTHDIEYAFGMDMSLREAKAVATASLNATVTFVTQLFGFIDAIYQKLHSDSKFSGEQAWSLTTQILDRICEDLYAPKEGVAEAMTVEDPSSICSHLLWASFRTHDVMKTYLDHHFENHPAISAEYVKFLATNSGFDKVEKMEITVAALKDRVEKAIDAAEKSMKRSNDATDKFSAMNKDLASLLKRVSFLEKGSK